MEAFELLAESQPTTELDELTTFFEHTFVAADDEDVQRLMVQQHSPSKPGKTQSTHTMCVCFVFLLLFTLAFTCF